ncbi:MAG: phosphoribosyl-ATP diphosphatase [Candidatus Buchananbacteria bacterium]
MEKIIIALFNTIKQRQKDLPANSYTASLFKRGRARICQKVGEEGVEVALAGMKNEPTEIISEAADLIYNLLVLLADCQLTPNQVTTELKKRFK